MNILPIYCAKLLNQHINIENRRKKQVITGDIGMILFS